MNGKPRKPCTDETAREAHSDYFTRDVSWRKLEAKYGIYHGTLYAAFKRLGLPLRTMPSKALKEKTGG